VLGQAPTPTPPVFVGACCRAPGILQCCEEALFDDWIWKERLPCWNWGYGG